MRHEEIVRITNEISGCTNAPAGVLVSLQRDTDEAVWGVVTAMNHDEMAEEMASIGFDTEGMITGEEFLSRFLGTNSPAVVFAESALTEIAEGIEQALLYSEANEFDAAYIQMEALFSKFDGARRAYGNLSGRHYL